MRLRRRGILAEPDWSITSHWLIDSASLIRPGKLTYVKALIKIACFFVSAKELATKKQAKYFLEPES
jgi:hypothetical protein